MRVADRIDVAPARAVIGTLRVPGDKSISHRYALLSALADGRTAIANYAPGADCASTLACLAALGAIVSRTPPERDGDPAVVTIEGRGLRGLTAPAGPLDCGNSGSTMRMISGVLAAHPFLSTLIGDASLSRRPMRRIIGPLTQMGATIQAGPGDRPPVTIRGGSLTGIHFAPETPSAQVKSAVLLAGLQASGETQVVEPACTRDHTERALAAFGATVDVDGRTVSLRGGQRLSGQTLRVPGDISSAAFLAVAAAALPGSDLTITDVGLNPTRAALVQVLRRAGAEVESTVESHWSGEPVGRLHVRHAVLRDVVIAPDEVPELIDELPVLATLGTFGGSVTVSGAGELRVKESDRIAELVAGLRAMGADADERPDGFQIRRGPKLTGGAVHAHGDHRLAMAFAIAALGASGPTQIDGADAVAVSYPSFFDDLDRLARRDPGAGGRQA
ncbi:MAG: 3-phosphoshikimate 1-carboxyvinyltransferase [Acidobacteria bacterium RIFCSPLOWO2_12_FULL_67_14b]|nr:MAG: 3-phosphoshikimate 1-carboxyvinyltransferase [Acidobacteria bacterium RIFCSPLOWO2_12_FULL_67_14b]